MRRAACVVVRERTIWSPGVRALDRRPVCTPRHATGRSQPSAPPSAARPVRTSAARCTRPAANGWKSSLVTSNSRPGCGLLWTCDLCSSRFLTPRTRMCCGTRAGHLSKAPKTVRSFVFLVLLGTAFACDESPGSCIHNIGGDQCCTDQANREDSYYCREGTAEGPDGACGHAAGFFGSPAGASYRCCKEEGAIRSASSSVR